MADYYEPELGQAAFGQPHKLYNVSDELVSALLAIESRLMSTMEQIDKDFERELEDQQ